MTNQETSDTMTRLFNEADDGEADIIREVAYRAGILWECYGPDGDHSCWTNVAHRYSVDFCECCGTRRPADDRVAVETLKELAR